LVFFHENFNLNTLKGVFCENTLSGIIPLTVEAETTHVDRMWTKSNTFGPKTLFWAQIMSFLVFCSKIRFFNFFAYFFKKAFRNALELSKDPKKMQMEQKVVEDWLNKKNRFFSKNFF
jgi:hypothetical protein